jgi:hypothetical protein
MVMVEAERRGAERVATNGQQLGSTKQPTSQKREALANAMELWTDELCHAYGFRRDCWYDRDGRRTIELLGPDSPGEYTISFPLWRLRLEHFQDLTRDIVLWIDARGREYTGDYVPGIVPVEYREGD